MRALLLLLSRAQIILGLLVMVVVLTPPVAERYGDRLNVALPILAWACAASSGDGAEFALRYGVMFVAAHGTKIALGATPVNLRPAGGDKGFPSAHTSSAVIGASSLVHDCLKRQPVAQAAVILAAGFVGASRIEAGKHDIWQVLAGALLGYGCDRLLRRSSPLRDRLRRGLQAAGAALRRGRRRLWLALRIGWAGLSGRSLGDADLYRLRARIDAT